MNIEEILKSKFENEEVRAYVNLLYTARYMYNKVASIVRKYGIYYEQFTVLRTLRRSAPEPMSQKDILERMTDKSSNLTRIISRLKSKELVSVVKAIHDKREYKITITQKGMDLLQLIDEKEGFGRDPQTCLTEKENIKLNQLLDKMRDGKNGWE